MITVVKERRAEDLQVDTGRAGSSWFLHRTVCSSKRRNREQIMTVAVTLAPSCCKAGVILITYASRSAERHGGPKASRMRREPSCITANALLWSDLWNGPTRQRRRLYFAAFSQPCHRPREVLAARICALLCFRVVFFFWFGAIFQIFRWARLLELHHMKRNHIQTF